MRRAILGVLVSTVLAFGTASSLRAGVGSPAWVSVYLDAVKAGESLVKLPCITPSEREAYDKQAFDAMHVIAMASPAAFKAPRQFLTPDQQAVYDAWSKVNSLQAQVARKPICTPQERIDRDYGGRRQKPVLTSPPKEKGDAGKPGSVAGQPVKPEGAKPKDVELAKKTETGEPGSSAARKSETESRVVKSPAPPASVSPTPTSSASSSLCRQSPCGCAKQKPPKVCPAGSGCACTKG